MSRPSLFNTASATPSSWKSALIVYGVLRKLRLTVRMQQITNALMDDKAEIRTADSGPPNTFVDGRNALFLLYAAIYAKSRDIVHIITGVCETDFSGYPDCRDVFVKSMDVTLNLAMDYAFQIHTPLMYHQSKLGRWPIIWARSIMCAPTPTPAIWAWLAAAVNAPAACCASAGWRNIWRKKALEFSVTVIRHCRALTRQSRTPIPKTILFAQYPNRSDCRVKARQ